MPDVAGILVGGRGTRMGGVAKGLLFGPPELTSTGLRPPETLVARWRRLFGEVGLPCVLVGRHEAYAELGMDCIDDEPPGIGPLGGLISLFAHARGGMAVAVACDLPYVSRALLEKLVLGPMRGSALAPRQEHLWQPLFARYAADRALAKATERAAAGNYALQGLLDELDTDPLPLTEDELSELRDWDTWADRASTCSTG